MKSSNLPSGGRAVRVLKPSVIAAAVAAMIAFTTGASPMIAPIPATTPTAAQRAQIGRKYGMFCHFGINTYANQEWTDGSLPPETYAPPADLAQNVDGWVKTAHDAGMRYFLCICKHHDGFCMWDTAATDYGVANPKVANHTDVARAVSNACHRYGISFAVYYSLWDRHQHSEQDPLKYKEYMKRQLTELMTNYGPVSELWLDGSWVQPVSTWHLDEVYDTVRRLQPDCQITSNWTIGDAHGKQVTPDKLKQGMDIKYWPSDFRISDPYLPATPDPKLYGHDGKLYYMPYEATVTLSDNGTWFYHPGTGAKSVDGLEAIFETATAQDNCLVFNLPPDRDGNLVADQRDALMSLADRLHLTPGGPFPKPAVDLAIGATATASAVWNDPNDKESYAPGNVVDGSMSSRWACGPSGTKQAWLAIDFGKPIAFDQLRISEYAKRVKQFRIEVPDGHDGWTPLATGTAIGPNRIIGVPPTRAAKVRLDILDATDAPSIYEVRVLKTKGE
jgi:alpha-L-fucosidase